MATTVHVPAVAGMSGGGTYSPTRVGIAAATYAWTSDGVGAAGSYAVNRRERLRRPRPPTSFTVTPDADAPQSSITCNGGSDCDGSYTGNVQVTLSASDSGSGVDKIYYTTDGTTTPGPGSGSSTTNASTISVPAGSTLQYRAADNVGNLENTHSKTLAGAAPPAPTLTLQATDAADFVAPSGTTVFYNPSAASGSFTITAGVDSSVTTVHFPVLFGGDLLPDTSGIAATTYAWTTGVSANGSYDVNSSNGFGDSTTASFTVTPDADAPQSSITCNGGSDCDGSYTGNVQVTLSASDSGSGVDKIYYTTDGTTTPGPGSGSSTTNASTISVPAGSTLQYRAADNVGNLENTHSKTLAGAAPPAPTLTLQATDAADFVAPSGTTVFYNPSAASGSFTITAGVDSSVTTVHFPVLFGGDLLPDTSGIAATTYAWTTGVSANGSYDVNSSNGFGDSTTASFTVTPDADAPQSSITCNGGSDCDGSYTGNVQVTLSASDSGSGVDKIYYTTDGTTTPGPGSGSSTTNASTISVPAGSTLQYRAADNVGNLENTHSKTLAQTTGGGTQILNPIADSYVLSTSPTTNYGTSANIYVDADGIKFSYLKFDLSGVSGTVTGVTLRIYAASSQSIGYRVFAVADTSWGELTLNYNNKPVFAATSSGASGAVTTGSWTNVTLPPALAQAAVGGLISLGLDTTSTTNLKLDGKESGVSLAPQLVVTTS